LLACYLMLIKKMSVKQIQSAFGQNYLNSLCPFRDAGIGRQDFPITVIDVLRGLMIGITYNWVTADRFRELSSLDCSWIVPRRILACASPCQKFSKEYPS
jgi:hypothetical protein